MFFTLLMITATMLQVHKIRSLCSRLTKQIGNRASAVFYYVAGDDGLWVGTYIIHFGTDDHFSLFADNINTSSVSSELCTNKSEARIDDFFWYNDQQRGCAVTPMQRVHLGPWITFPDEPSFTPFEVKCPPRRLDTDDSPISVLIETGICPETHADTSAGLAIEDYGQLVAWKVDSHIGIIIKSNVRKCSELVTAAFVCSNRYINDRLPIIRIESECVTSILTLWNSRYRFLL
jgi:biotin---protein ligase